MFNNIGKKIKILTLVVFILEVCGVIIYGFILMKLRVWIGLLVMVAGIFVSWILSFFSYGFGELIDSSAETAENTQAMLQKLPVSGPNQQPSAPGNSASSSNWFCTYCGTKNGSTASICSSCKRPRY